MVTNSGAHGDGAGGGISRGEKKHMGSTLPSGEEKRMEKRAEEEGVKKSVEETLREEKDERRVK